MKHQHRSRRRLVALAPRLRLRPDGPSSCAAAGAQRDAGRLRLRRRSVERPASGRRCPAADDGRRASSRTRRSRPTANWIAFTGQYDGNTDVFVIPAQGGVPKRLTWHPDPDIALGWTPRRQAGAVLVDANELLALPRALPGRPRRRSRGEAAAADGATRRAFSPDGDRLAYVPLSRAFTAWKRYRGGQATPIWIADAVQQPDREDPARQLERLLARCGSATRSTSSATAASRSRFTRTTSRRRKCPRPSRNAGMDFKSASAGPGGDRHRAVRPDSALRPRVRHG